jgi:putative ABC transport system permease protein
VTWWEACRTAQRTLRTNKLRSLLTILGIIVGVASVITMVAVGAGAQTQIAEQIRTLGANVLMIEPGTLSDGAARTAAGARHTLTEDDAVALAELPTIHAAAPSVRGTVQVVRGNRNWNTVVNGTTVDMFVIREWQLSAGRYFSPAEEERAGRVALIGETVAKELFGGRDPIGGEMRILNTPFEVIGVLSEKGVSGGGRNQDDVVFVPIQTAKVRLIGSASQVNRNAVAYVLVKATSNDDVAPAQAQVRLLLRQRHRLGPDQEDDFVVTVPAEAMALQHASTRTFAWLLASLASVSLLVGGISIMNIMLVSVSERTREIGLRLALGARRRDIRNQFLMEAVSLCLFGGLIGVLVGGASAMVMASLAGWPIFIGPDAVVFALLFAGSTGIFFGWYPARKAARLEPVEALRVE